MHLHEQAGYTVRGSVAYKRLSQATFAVDQPIQASAIVADGRFVPPSYSDCYYEPQQPTIVVTGAAPTMEIYKGKS
jgi:hypothetical protein